MTRILPLIVLTLGATLPAEADAGWGQKARSLLHRTPPKATAVAAEVATLDEAPPIGDPAPSWFRKARPGNAHSAEFRGDRTIKGRLSATRERALADARLQLNRAVANWAAPDVPRQWAIPRELTDSMIRATHVEPVARDLGLPDVKDMKDMKVVYEAGFLVDFSSQKREQIVNVYTRDLVARRISLLGGTLGLTLIGLAGLAGYIRADEATKGYYTNRLRLVAAAGVGAASVAFYRWAF